MVRPRQNITKARITISLDPQVLKDLQKFCSHNQTHPSTFINSFLARQFNSEERVMREWVKILNMQFQEAKFLLESYYTNNKEVLK